MSVAEEQVPVSLYTKQGLALLGGSQSEQVRSLAATSKYVELSLKLSKRGQCTGKTRKGH